MKNFISAEKLQKLIGNEKLVILDCRSNLINKDYGMLEYNKGHIKTAQFVDFKRMLVGTVLTHGGRSPFPEISDFKKTIEALGISNDTMVVAYDDMNLATAARICFMLRFAGHNNNFILDGGINYWKKCGYDLTTEVPKVTKGTFNLKTNSDIRVDYYYVKERLEDKNTLLIDSRAYERYTGEVEPIDKKSGHIPGAINMDWKKLLNEDGLVPSLEFLKEKFSDAFKFNETIVYCGSGVDANFNYMLLDEIGIKAKVYSGSWSDWISF